MITQLTAAAFTATLVNAARSRSRAADENGVVLGQVFTLGMPGLKYPPQFLGFSDNEPIGLENQITPVGLRQHYFIGNEQRVRYVEEAGLLNTDFNLLSVDLKTPFSPSNIQSMEAQMMGMYPGSTMNNLNAWEQNNAVPPIDADYSQWQ